MKLLENIKVYLHLSFLFSVEHLILDYTLKSHLIKTKKLTRLFILLFIIRLFLNSIQILNHNLHNSGFYVNMKCHTRIRVL